MCKVNTMFACVAQLAEQLIRKHLLLNSLAVLLISYLIIIVYLLNRLCLRGSVGRAADS